MDNTQTNKLAMYHAVLALLQATDETGGIPGVPAQLSTLAARLAELDTLAATQLRLTAGKTARRDELLADMIETALDVANAVATHADAQKLTELARAVAVTPSAFARLRLLHRPWLAQQVHAAAQGVLPELATYGVTAATLAALQAKIESAKAGLDQPRSTIVEKSAATAQMLAVFREIDAQLEGQIDRLVFPLRKTSPKFHARYQVARQIAARPGGRNPAEPATPAEAASTGRVDTLLVGEGKHISGKLLRHSGLLEPAAMTTPAHGDDVLDDLAEMVLRQDGHVLILPENAMPTDTGVAAIYRY